MTIYSGSVSLCRGAALFVGLMLLLILTLLGLSASNVSIMQERMASNHQESNEAFQLAEATTREIETRIREYVGGGSGGLGAIPLWSELDLEPGDCMLEYSEEWDGWDDAPWRTAPTTGNDYLIIDLSDFVNEAGLPVASACRPLSEVGLSAVGEYYLVVARGFSPNGTGRAILQTIFYWP